jgi:negative regulator of replication initiation
MNMYSIEVDEKIWTYLQQHAEPLVDTPNSVLTRLLFGENDKEGEDVSVFKIPSVSVKGSPKSLAQILEVVYEMEVNGYTRIQATNRVAKKRGTAPQTITDKYCRQLNKRAHEIDELLNEPGYEQFRELLKSKFSDHEGVIDTYFDSLILSGTG